MVEQRSTECLWNVSQFSDHSILSHKSLYDTLGCRRVAHLARHAGAAAGISIASQPKPTIFTAVLWNLRSAAVTSFFVFQGQKWTSVPGPRHFFARVHLPKALV